MIALDTNLLVYAFNPGKPEFARARAVMNALSADQRPWGFALGSVVEFWNLMTRRVVGGPMASAQQAGDYLHALLEAGAQLWCPLGGFGQRLLASAGEQGLTGRRIFDLQIALTAVENGATELWTHDVSFRAVPGLRVVDPLA